MSRDSKTNRCWTSVSISASNAARISLSTKTNRVISSDRILPFNPSRYRRAISPRTPASVSRAIALRGDRTSAFGWCDNDMSPVHWGGLRPQYCNLPPTTNASSCDRFLPSIDLGDSRGWSGKLVDHGGRVGANAGWAAVWARAVAGGMTTVVGCSCWRAVPWLAVGTPSIRALSGWAQPSAGIAGIAGFATPFTHTDKRVFPIKTFLFSKVL